MKALAKGESLIGVDRLPRHGSPLKGLIISLSTVSTVLDIVINLCIELVDVVLILNISIIDF